MYLHVHDCRFTVLSPLHSNILIKTPYMEQSTNLQVYNMRHCVDFFFFLFFFFVLMNFQRADTGHWTK